MQGRVCRRGQLHACTRAYLPGSAHSGASKGPRSVASGGNRPLTLEPWSAALGLTGHVKREGGRKGGGSLVAAFSARQRDVCGGSW